MRHRHLSTNNAVLRLNESSRIGVAQRVGKRPVDEMVPDKVGGAQGVHDMSFVESYQMIVLIIRLPRET